MLVKSKNRETMDRSERKTKDPPLPIHRPDTKPARRKNRPI